MNGDVHGGHARCGSAAGASRFLTGLVTCFATHDGIPAVAPRRLAPVDAGRHADQLGEAGAEGAQRRAADREADLGDAEVAAPQQRHRALDAPRHQVAVRRLAVGQPELAAEVPGRHVHAAGERLDVQRLRVLPVDPVADAAQPREVAQALLRGGSAGHPRDRATSRRCGHADRVMCRVFGAFSVVAWTCCRPGGRVPRSGRSSRSSPGSRASAARRRCRSRSASPCSTTTARCGARSRCRSRWTSSCAASWRWPRPTRRCASASRGRPPYERDHAWFETVMAEHYAGDDHERRDARGRRPGRATPG